MRSSQPISQTEERARELFAIAEGRTPADWEAIESIFAGLAADDLLRECIWLTDQWRQCHQKLTIRRDELKRREKARSIERATLFAGITNRDRKKSAAGRTAADARHGAPGGARAKAEVVRLEWASGKYSTRDQCAEEVSPAQGISFSTARKALRNTPEPKGRKR